MRVFILCALLAMATTVSSQSLCTNQTGALESNATIKALEPTNTGCNITDINYDDTTICPPSTDGFTYNCACVATYVNKSAWDSAIASAGGRTCSLSYEYSLVGSTVVANVTKEVRFIASHTGVEIFGIGSACNETDIKAQLTPFVTKMIAILANATTDIKKTNVTWTSGTFSVSACNVPVTGSQSYVPTSTTTSPPTNNAGGNGTATNGTTAPPTTTPAPAGSSSSTGRSGASIIASSFALVASLIAAVTILA